MTTSLDELSDFFEPTGLFASLREEVRDFVRHLRERDQVQRHAALALLKDPASPTVEQGRPGAPPPACPPHRPRRVSSGKPPAACDRLPDRNCPNRRAGPATPRSRAGSRSSVSPVGRSRGGLPSTRSSSTRRTATNDSSAEGVGRPPAGQQAQFLVVRQGAGPDQSLSKLLAIWRSRPPAARQPGQPAPPSPMGRSPPLRPRPTGPSSGSSPASSPSRSAEFADRKVQGVGPPGGHQLPEPGSSNSPPSSSPNALPAAGPRSVRAPCRRPDPGAPPKP